MQVLPTAPSPTTTHLIDCIILSLKYKYYYYLFKIKSKKSFCEKRKKFIIKQFKISLIFILIPLIMLNIIKIRTGYTKIEKKIIYNNKSKCVTFVAKLGLFMLNKHFE